MSYPTNVIELLKLSDEEWEALLASVWNAPVPREVVRINANAPDLVRFEREAGSPRIGRPKGVSYTGSRRRDYAWARINEGAKRPQVAAELGIGLSMLSRILTGDRN